METWRRMEAIACLGIFGESIYEASLDQWTPYKDISLYLFYQPITVDKSYSSALNKMYKKVNNSPKMYFVMHLKKLLGGKPN